MSVMNNVILACKKAGVNVIWVSWGYDVIETVKGDAPDYMVNTPREIVKSYRRHILNMNELRAVIYHIEFWVAKFLTGNKVKVIVVQLK